MFTRFLRPLIRSTDGRNWCKTCGGINKCYDWCPVGGSGS
jgi:hypothetical protein